MRRRVYASERFIGSVDVDLALDHRKISEMTYKSILDLLRSRGYEQGKQPFIFRRKVRVGDREVNVEVDLLAGIYSGTGPGHRHQKIQTILARKARGCDLAVELSHEVTVTGTLPEGGVRSVTFRIASVVPFVIMKALALDERLKEKDA